MPGKGFKTKHGISNCHGKHRFLGQSMVLNQSIYLDSKPQVETKVVLLSSSWYYYTRASKQSNVKMVQRKPMSWSQCVLLSLMNSFQVSFRSLPVFVSSSTGLCKAIKKWKNTFMKAQVRSSLWTCFHSSILGFYQYLLQHINFLNRKALFSVCYIFFCENYSNLRFL